MGCQRDDFEDDILESTKEKTTVDSSGLGSIIGEKQISQNKGLSAILSKFQDKSKSKGIVTSTDQYGFKIDPSVAKVYKKDEYRSYSFLVTSNPENKTGNMQNFIVSSNPDGSYDTFLVDFGFSQRSFKTMNEKEINKTQPVFTALNISSTKASSDSDPTGRLASQWLICIYTYELKEHICGCPGGSTYTWELVSRDCVSNGGGGGYTSPGTPSLGSGYQGGYPNGGSPNGDDGPGNSIIILPMDSETVLLYRLTQEDMDQQEIDKVEELLGAADEDLKNELIDLFNSNTEYGNLDQFVLDLLEFNDENSSDPETDDFIEEAIKIKKALPGARFDRIEELSNKISDNPFALLENCAEENGLDTESYLDLYNHELPQSCKDKLNLLGLGFDNQPLSEGNVPLANIDYYSVEITDMPDFDQNDLPDSKFEIYQAFRDRFTDFASGERQNFQFTCDVPGNTDNTADIRWLFEPKDDYNALLFYAENPIGAIFNIEAETSGFFSGIASDEGAIIISEFTNNDWIGSTITTPSNGSQPFSGNRQWGLITNDFGNLEIYTRAVDVAKVASILNIIPSTDTDCQQSTYYDIASATWRNMLEEIKQWVNNHDGQAEIVQETALKVDKDRIEYLLTSNEAIDQINCD